MSDVVRDPGENRDLAGRRPEVLKQLLSEAEKAREDLGDALTGRTGRGVRPCPPFLEPAKAAGEAVTRR